MKKNTKIGKVVFEYLTRNTKHDEVPKGYVTKRQILDATGYSIRQFKTFMRKAKDNKMVEVKWFRVAAGAYCQNRPHYKLSPDLAKVMGLASR